MNDEKDIWTATPSLWIGFKTYFWCGLMSLICIAVSFAGSKIALLGVLLMGLIIVLRVFRIKAIGYHLTTERLRITSGIFSRKVIEIELFRIRDLSMEQGFIHRLLSIGTVKAISTDEDAEAIFLSGIKDAVKVKEQLRKFVMQSRKATGTRDVDVAAVR